MHALTWKCGFQVPDGYKPGEIIDVPVPYSVNVMLEGDDKMIVPSLANELTAKLPAKLSTGYEKRKNVRY